MRVLARVNTVLAGWLDSVASSLEMRSQIGGPECVYCRPLTRTFAPESILSESVGSNSLDFEDASSGSTGALEANMREGAYFFGFWASASCAGGLGATSYESMRSANQFHDLLRSA